MYIAGVHHFRELMPVHLNLVSFNLLGKKKIIFTTILKKKKKQ